MRAFSQYVIAAVKIVKEKTAVEDMPEYPAAESVGLVRAQQAVPPNERERQYDENGNEDIPSALSSTQ